MSHTGQPSCQAVRGTWFYTWIPADGVVNTNHTHPSMKKDVLDTHPNLTQPHDFRVGLLSQIFHMFRGTLKALRSKLDEDSFRLEAT